MYTNLKKARIQAMKDKDEVAKSLYSTMLGEIDKIAKDTRVDVTDAIVEKVAKKFASNLESNIKIYKEKGADYSTDEAELELVSAYLPVVMSEDATRLAIKGIVANEDPDTFKGNMGKLMGAIKQNITSGIDMKLASKIAREFI